MPKLTPSEAKMIVTGAQTMYCTRCTFHFLAGSDGIIRHGAPTDEGLYPEGILTWFEGCPLAGKSFAFPEALPIVGIEVPMNNHVHVFDSEVYALRYQYSSGKYTGAVDLGCECGARRTFTPSDGQPTKEFWGVDLGKPNPPLPSQPPHLAWDGKIEVADFMPPGEVWLVSGGQFRKIVNIGTGEDQP